MFLLPHLSVMPSSSCAPPFPSDLLFGVPGKYSGVNLYNRKRVVTYTITLGLQRYDSRYGW